MACGALLFPGSASADVVSAQLELHGGGAGGTGLFGDRQDDAFFVGARGAGYGATLGVEIVFIDGWVEHNQYRDGDGLIGTWTQFMVGFDIELDLGGKRGVGSDGKGGYNKWYTELGIGAGFGVGTGQQVDPPLDNSQVTDKAFLAQAAVGIGFRLSKPVSIGISVPVQAAYGFKSGTGVGANDPETQYASVQGALLLNLRFKLKLK